MPPQFMSTSQTPSFKFSWVSFQSSDKFGPVKIAMATRFNVGRNVWCMLSLSCAQTCVSGLQGQVIELWCFPHLLPHFDIHISKRLPANRLVFIYSIKNLYRIDWSCCVKTGYPLWWIIYLEPLLKLSLGGNPRLKLEASLHWNAYWDEIGLTFSIWEDSSWKTWTLYHCSSASLQGPSVCEKFQLHEHGKEGISSWWSWGLPWSPSLTQLLCKVSAPYVGKASLLLRYQFARKPSNGLRLRKAYKNKPSVFASCLCIHTQYCLAQFQSDR